MLLQLLNNTMVKVTKLVFPFTNIDRLFLVVLTNLFLGCLRHQQPLCLYVGYCTAEATISSRKQIVSFSFVARSNVTDLSKVFILIAVYGDKLLF